MVKHLWETYERKYCIDDTEKTFSKTEIPTNINFRGESTTPWMSKERIRNEYLALQLIKEATSIPVPEPLSLNEQDGSLCITTNYIDGVGLDELPQSIRSQAVVKANIFIRNVVLPQLATLKSHCNGSLTGDIIPPCRVHEKYPTSKWRQVRTSTELFTFCHNDLGQHNILCDPETGDVLAIIDWEYSGYYDPRFEGSLWLKPYNETVNHVEEVELLASILTRPNADTIAQEETAQPVEKIVP